ncbi:MAG: hypothetical protein A2136_00625 [Chloroflexi bacterium RBG_16_54_11]|nr:MAG: hypothetical protein A2136_00625 [Chloroflexi bacterium RBG_16_54_11]
MEEIDEHRQGLLSALEVTVSALGKIVAAIPAAAWQAPTGQADSMPHYILAHLHALESQVFAAQLPRFLDENNLALPLFDARAWMAGHYTPGKPARAIYAEFSHLRTQEVEMLRALSPPGWSRRARHAWWGVRTLQWLVELQLDHSQRHQKDLAASLAL